MPNLEYINMMRVRCKQRKTKLERISNMQLQSFRFGNFPGIGIASVCVSAFIGLYYNVIIGYCFYYFFASMSDPLPWAEELSVNATNTTGST